MQVHYSNDVSYDCVLYSYENCVIMVLEYLMVHSVRLSLYSV